MTLNPNRLTPRNKLATAIFSGLILALMGAGLAAKQTQTSDTTSAASYAPLPVHGQTAREILRTLDKFHYKRIKLNDEFSSRVLDQYLLILDPAKTHFLQVDIDAFEKYRTQLDDELKRGDLKAAFAIYNRYHERRIVRLKAMLSMLGEIEKFVFTADEHLELDRKNAPWLADAKTADILWRQLVKNDVLNLLLSEKKLEEIGPILEKRYRDQLNLMSKTNSDDIFSYFMSAFTHGYDPHTDYFPPRDSENFDIHMRLSLEGIGALLQRDEEFVKVVQLIVAGPADRGKQLKPADRIIGVGQGIDGEIVDVVGWRLDDVVAMIRGPKGSVVRLNVIPADAADLTQTRIIQITRDTVKLEEQSAKKRIIPIERGDKTYKVGVIELPTFYVDFRAFWAGDPDYRSSTRDVESLIHQLKAEDIDALIVDLRNNGGGSLQEANDMTGLFIPSGPVVQVRDAKNKIELVADHNPKIVYTGPLAVLVNRMSASASEIFAGAIQDHARGIIVGSQTFGKGTVQNMKDLAQLKSSQLKYTQAMYYRISGDSTQERGIIPDILFPELLDKDQIGESSLPEALPWDQIEPARYRKLANLEPVIDHLTRNHVTRVATDPDFIYLNERLELLRENRSKTSVSLKKIERIRERQQAEQQLLAMENKRRKSKGMKPLPTFAALEAEQQPSEDKKDNPADSMLQETGNILLDWLSHAQKQVAVQFDNGAALSPHTD